MKKEKLNWLKQKMPTNPKTGEKVSWREFFRRWKDGVSNMNPLQQNTSMLLGQITSLVGVIWGIVFSLIIGYYWMMIILIGGLIVLGTQMLGTFQQRKILNTMFNYKEVQNVTG